MQVLCRRLKPTLLLNVRCDAGLKARSTQTGELDAKPVAGQANELADDLRIVLAETEREATLSDILRAQDNVTSLTLAIGSEGGWTAEELELFEQSHWISASLGETILRAETAAIAALAIARAEV